MAAFEQIIYAQHADQPSSCRSLIGKYAALAPVPEISARKRFIPANRSLTPHLEPPPDNTPT